MLVMSHNTKRWIVHLLRVAVTAVAVIWVVNHIQFRDKVLIHADLQGVWEVRWDVRDIRRGGGRAIVEFSDGHTEQYRDVDVRLERQGFLTLFEHTNKPLFFSMMVAMLVPLLFLSLRWWLLLRGHGFQARLGQVFFITYAGSFFNNFLPGSVGGDLTKAILAASGEERKAAVAGTVILDRIIGLAVMIVLGSTCLTPYVGRFEDKRLAWLLYGLLGSMILGYLVYFSPPGRRLLGLLPFKKTIAELDGVFRSAQEKKGLVATAAGLSFGAQITGILVIYGLARAMHIPGVGLWMFFIFEPIIFIVTALPISVGGWGVQEFVYEQLFGHFGRVDPNQAIALSVLYKLSAILVSIPGGLLFAMGATRRTPGTPPKA
jgi:uncharacterized membrane protein YbhN (UPF0104 family)